MFYQKNILNYVFTGLIALFPLSCLAISPVEPQMSMSELLAQFTSYAEKTQKNWQVPGLSIAIVKNGKIIYAEGFGQRNIQNAPVNPNTIFDIASLTKSFTAALLAMQIENGQYTWNTKVLKLYPSFKLYDPNTTKNFEVRDLILHDSGLPPGATDALSNFGYDTEHLIYALRFIQPVAPFRDQFAYEDIFPQLAKKIIEKSSNETYTDYLHRKIFGPLQMNDSYVCTEKKLNELSNVAQPFLYYAGKNYAYTKNYPYLSQRWALENGIGSGGIESSAIDIAKWLIFNINNGAADNTQIISAQNMNFMHSPQTMIKAGQAYGEGWFIDKQAYQPYTVLYHPGGGLGMHALMAYIPEAKIGIVILTNQYTNKVPEALSRRFFDLYFNKQPLKNWSKIYLKERAQDTDFKRDQCQAGQKPDLDHYTGTYFNPAYGDLILSKKDNHLLLTIGPQHIRWILTPCQHNTFKAYWPNPGKMDFPMLASGQDLVEFTVVDNIIKMTIPSLNDDGTGIFVKQ